MNMKRRSARGLDPGGWHGDPRRRGSLRAWLREPGSLTARLRRFGDTTVSRLREGRAAPNRDERWMPKIRRGADVMRREVVLKVDDRPWVFAHTLANREGVRLLRRAGRRALAIVLFADPRVQAGPLYFRELDARHPLYRSARPWCGEHAPSRMCARRAVFRRGRAWLLVTEVFLPAILESGS